MFRVRWITRYIVSAKQTLFYRIIARMGLKWLLFLSLPILSFDLFNCKFERCFPWKSVSIFDPFILFVQCHPTRRIEMKETDLLLIVIRGFVHVFRPQVQAEKPINTSFRPQKPCTSWNREKCLQSLMLQDFSRFSKRENVFGGCVLSCHHGRKIRP